jgi:hypothetical protein
MLLGIVAKNGIMMVDFANQGLAEGKSNFDAIHDASVVRFRPILMTGLAAIMGALPIALGYGADGSSSDGASPDGAPTADADPTGMDGGDAASALPVSCMDARERRNSSKVIGSPFTEAISPFPATGGGFASTWASIHGFTSRRPPCRSRVRFSSASAIRIRKRPRHWRSNSRRWGSR